MKYLYIFVLLARDIIRYFQRLKLRAYWRAKQVFVAGRASIVKDSFGELDFGRGVVISDGVLIIATTEYAENKIARLVVGDNTVINEYSNIRASGGAISIGANTMIAQGVSIIATNHQVDTSQLMMYAEWDQNKNGVTIGANVWIGAQSVILPGVIVGDGAVVAAGAVVSKDIGANEIWGGVPARFIRVRKNVVIHD